MPSPLRYTLDPRSRLVRLDYSSSASFDEWAAVMEAVIAEPQYESSFSFLVDRREADPLSSEKLLAMIEFIDLRMEHFRGSRWAIVVSSKADYGMGRMAQALSDGHPTVVEVFDDMDEAMLWLGVRQRR